MVYAFLPFLSAALYGLGYILLERILKSTNILSYMICSSIIFTSVLLIAGLIKRADISFAFLEDKRILLIFIGAMIANVGGWLITLFSLQNNSAVYTAFAEISYPLFTLLFLFLFFGSRAPTWHTLLGGAIVFIGSCILVWGQMKMGRGS